MSSHSPDSAEGPLLLAIDVGTSSVRALLFDAAGQVLTGSEARRSYALVVRSDGTVETDPTALLDQLWACLDEVLDWAGPRAGAIAGVATTTLVSNVVVVDEAGRPISPLMTYADTRPAEDVRTLREALDETVVHDRTGCHFHPSYLPARVLWARRTHPEWLQPKRRWITLGELMALQLFGRAAVSYSVASWSGLLDRHTSQWDQALLDFLGLPLDLFSSLVDVDVPWQGLSPTFAGRWPALRAVPWFPAIGDGAAANVGSGCVDPRQVCVTIGTTSAVRATLAAPVEHVPRGLWCYRVDGRRPLLGGALSEGGNVYAWLKATLRVRLGADETLEAALRAMPPDSHGLTFLPVLAGERSPGWEGSMRGTLHGLTLATTPLDVLRAGLEGVACRLGLIYQLLRPALPAEPTVIASGGALARSGVWAQMIADMLGKPLTLVPDEGASARGAAVLALEALGLRSDLGRTASAAGETFRPDAARHAIYVQAQQRQQALYALFAPAR